MRHVCTNKKNGTNPMKTKQVTCKPIYKKYMVRCGNQWCSGVRVVYEKHRKELITNTGRTDVNYVCCPGWSQVTSRSHGCTQPICPQPCRNGGKCVKPGQCSCLQGYTGMYCETITRVYSPCFMPCQNGGTCLLNGTCACSTGFSGFQCENDVDECKEFKPCDQICRNTKGGYECDCKESFALQNDQHSCRREDNDSGIEVGDLSPCNNNTCKEFQDPCKAFKDPCKDIGSLDPCAEDKLERLHSRLTRLEKIVCAKRVTEISKKDFCCLKENIDVIAKHVGDMKNQLLKIDNFKKEMTAIKCKICIMEERTKQLEGVYELHPEANFEICDC